MNLPKELSDLIGREVVSMSGLHGEIRDVTFYPASAGRAHSSGWHVTVVTAYGSAQQSDLSTFNAVWKVVET